MMDRHEDSERILLVLNLEEWDIAIAQCREIEARKKRELLKELERMTVEGGNQHSLRGSRVCC